MQHLETTLQVACVRWFRYQYPHLQRLLFAVPNGGSRNVLEAANLKRQGVLAGVSDLILLLPSKGKASLCIELKVGKNKLTKNQELFKEAATAAGSQYQVCRSFEEFVAVVKGYIH